MAIELQDTTVQSGEHLVEFYESERELARTVGGYLFDGAQAGAVAIVISTAAHRAALETELRSAGLDLAKAARDGTLVFLDAAGTMAQFMLDGQLDGDAFRRVVGTVVREAADTGRPVRAYGEMVALLWEAGQIVAAIELETLWNELAGELPFALLCAYDSASVSGVEHAEALHEICRLHSSVLHEPTGEYGGAPSPDRPAVELSASYPAEPAAARKARHFVAAALTRGGYSGALVDDARLVVTELATNAVVHARSPFSVAVEISGSRVRVLVHDGSSSEPKLRGDDLTAVSGRGLRLVDAVAAGWGVDMTAAGKTVWAQLEG